MSTLLKHRYDRAYVEHLASMTKTVFPGFEGKGFTRSVWADGWDDLELKQRMRRLSSMLHRFLPMPYRRQLAVLREVAPQLGGLEAMLFPDFVEQFGLEDWEASVGALEWFTQFSSAEFAVRPFILRDAERMLAVMQVWATHASEHVRRLASEGSRPRLPWAMALPALKADPTPVLPILERLKHDPSAYVRRSVANHLNDIAKDHPELVLRLAQGWLGQTAATDALVKHACRTLLKRGDPRALALFGFRSKVPVEVQNFRLEKPRLRIGEVLRFQFEVQHRAGETLRLRLEYAVDFVKANGRTSRKVFHLTEADFPPSRVRRFARQHRFCDFTTRKHYPGAHRLSILVNGVTAAEAELRLAAPKITKTTAASTAAGVRR